MHIIKMVKEVDSSDDESKIIASSLSSLLFGISIKKYSKYEEYKSNEYKLHFHDSNNRIIEISLGKEIIAECENNDVQVMMIHSENLLDATLDDSNISFHYWLNGIKNMNASENIKNIISGIFVSFKTEEDYEKFIKCNFRSSNG